MQQSKYIGAGYTVIFRTLCRPEGYLPLIIMWKDGREIGREVFDTPFRDQHKAVNYAISKLKLGD